MDNNSLKEYKIKLGNLSINEQKMRDLYLRKLALGEIQGPPTGYASIDKPWCHFYDNFDIEKIDELASRSIYQMLEKCTKDTLNMTAIYMPGTNNKGGIKLSYKKYLQENKKIAKSFDALGVKEGEIIPMILPNIPESRCSIYGLNIKGGVSYPILPSLPSNVLEKIIIDNGIDKVIIFSGFYEKYKDVLNKCNVKNVILADGTGMIPNYLKKVINSYAKMKGEKQPFSNFKDNEYNSKIITWSDFLSLGKKNIEVIPFYKKNSLAAIIGTSGTTGIPKGVKFSNEKINYQYLQHSLANLNYKVGDNLLDVLLQSISYGFSVMHYSGCLGLTSVTIPSLVTSQIADILYDLKIDHFTGGPVHCEYLKSSNLFNSGTLKPLKNFVSGGASLATETEMFLNKDKVYVRQGYGTTECLGGATAPVGNYKQGSLGIPHPLTTVAIFKPGTDEELRNNEVGEICVCGKAIMDGYLNNEEETKSALITHNDGKIWLHTKDLGYCDEEGRIFFEARISDTFMRCGFNIHPNKIAEFINSFDYVSECFIIGVDHCTEQKVPVAFLTLNPKYHDKEKQIIEKLKEECYNNLDEFAIPYEWVVVESLPRNIGGKISGKDLLEKYKIDFSNNKSGDSFKLLKEKK